MTSRVQLIWLAFLAIILSGCDSAEDLINRRLPPVPAEQHRAAAIRAAHAGLAQIKDANAGFNLRIEDVTAVVNASGVAEKLGVARLQIRGDRQLILAETEVARKFSKNDFPELDENTRRLIEELKPEIKGRITLGLGLTTTTAIPEGGRLTIGVRLLPLFRNIEVERVTVEGEPDVDVLVTLMNRLAGKVASELSLIEVAKLSFPVTPFPQGDVSRSIALKNGIGDGEKISVSARPVSLPFQLHSAVWLVDGGNATFIVELVPTGTSPAANSVVPAGEDFEQLQTEFSRKLMEGLDLSESDSNWIAVSKRLVAKLLNAALEQAQPCLTAKASLPDQTFSRKIEIPDEMRMDCAPMMDCTPTRDCTTANVCDQTEDCTPARDCEVCALGACFDDPACAREKAAARYGCEVRKAGRKIECERLGTPAKTVCENERAAEQASCEAQKSTKKLACEAGRRELQKLAATGKFAKFGGTVSGTADVSICIKEFKAAPSLDRIEGVANITGEGAVDLGIEFVPLEIGGYFACQFPWNERKHIPIGFPERTAKLDSALVLETSGSSAMLRTNIKTSVLAASMREDLRELLRGSYSMSARCAPVGPMLHEMTLDVTQSIPAIKREFGLPGEDRALVLSLEPAAFHISGNNVVGKAAYSSNAKALILDADKGAVPAN